MLWKSFLLEERLLGSVTILTRKNTAAHFDLRLLVRTSSYGLWASQTSQHCTRASLNLISVVTVGLRSELLFLRCTQLWRKVHFVLKYTRWGISGTPCAGTDPYLPRKMQNTEECLWDTGQLIIHHSHSEQHVLLNMLCWEDLNGICALQRYYLTPKWPLSVCILSGHRWFEEWRTASNYLPASNVRVSLPLIRIRRASQIFKPTKSVVAELFGCKE